MTALVQLALANLSSFNVAIEKKPRERQLL